MKKSLLIVEEEKKSLKKSIRDIDIKGKKVLMRADLNVPLDDKHSITDDSRIRAVLPTIKFITENGGKVILMSHLGRPKGEVKNEFCLTPVVDRLSTLLKTNVKKADDCIGEEAIEAVNSMASGDVLLLENLRFHREETENDPQFAKQLASLADVYVNDAFGTCHRAHASTEGVTKYIPSVAGFLVEKEIEYFEKATGNPAHPFTLILGGAKVKDKIPVIENMLPKIDFLLIGGAMAYTFLKAKNISIGDSRVENNMMVAVENIFKAADKNNVTILLPEDHIVAREITPEAKTKLVELDIPQGWIGLDVGPETIKKFKEVLRSSKTIVWNGPVGLFEMKQFAYGTGEIANFLSTLDATTIIGGGDTAAAINQLGLKDKMSHISTGGGASLEYLEGKDLPGIAALNDKE